MAAILPNACKVGIALRLQQRLGLLGNTVGRNGFLEEPLPPRDRKGRFPVLIRIPPLCVPLLGLSALNPVPCGAQSPSPEVQIASAVLAAPEAARSGAAVLGYDSAGELVTLREGRNGLVCLADDPEDPGFSVACYHESLEPYMARGRELRAQGVTDGTDRNRIRWEEADRGTLEMPKAPATLYVLTGAGFDSSSGFVREAYLRYVVYTPWATVEATGLPDRPMAPGSPWLMFPGTAGAHIMISPPVPGG